MFVECVSVSIGRRSVGRLLAQSEAGRARSAQGMDRREFFHEKGENEERLEGLRGGGARGGGRYE